MVEKNEGKVNANFFSVLTKYDMSSVKIEDKGLEKYINLDIDKLYVGGVFSNKMFAKARIPIIERLINNLMRTEKYTGKKTKACKVVRTAFEIVEKKTKSNPMQVFIHALQNAAPKEEITRLRFGGISVPKAVDTAPQRRLDIVLRNISKGSVSASHKNRRSIESCLADEIVKASKNDVSSFAVGKKNDMERVAKSAR